ARLRQTAHPAPWRRLRSARRCLRRSVRSWNLPIRFLDPETIHAGECIGRVLLEGVPAIEIEQGLSRKPRCILLLRAQIEFKTEKLYAACRQLVLDLRQ